MKTFVINLDKRPDRMIEMETANVPFQYERFTATDSSTFTDEKNKFMRGHLGCWNSHLRLLKHIKELGIEMALVLEDDCQFIQEYNLDEIMSELPDDWDLLYLGGLNKAERKPYSKHLDVAQYIYQTHAYIIRNKFLDTLISTVEKYPYKIDIVFSQALSKGNCFITNPTIANQRESFSDITLK